MRTRCVVRGAWFDPAGFTLLEVVVTLALFGSILGVSGLALASLREPREIATTRDLIAARDSAIQTGHRVVVTILRADTGKYHAPRTTHILFLPDGRGIGAGVDQLTGAPLGTR